MKGNFIKNFIISWRGVRAVFLYITACQLLFYLFAGTAAAAYSVYLDFSISVLTASLALTICEKERKNNLYIYGSALPGGRSGMVYGLYAYTLAYIGVITAAVMLIYTPFVIFFPNMINLLKLVWAPVYIAMAPMLTLSLTLPLYYRFGKNAATVLFTVIVLFIVVFAIKNKAAGVSLWNAEVINLFGFNLSALAPFIPIILIALLTVYALSALLSARLCKTVEM